MISGLDEDVAMEDVETPPAPSPAEPKLKPSTISSSTRGFRAGAAAAARQRAVAFERRSMRIALNGTLSRSLNLLISVPDLALSVVSLYHFLALTFFGTFCVAGGEQFCFELQYRKEMCSYNALEKIPFCSAAC